VKYPRGTKGYCFQDTVEKAVNKMNNGITAEPVIGKSLPELQAYKNNGASIIFWATVDMRPGSFPEHCVTFVSCDGSSIQFKDSWRGAIWRSSVPTVNKPYTSLDKRAVVLRKGNLPPEINERIAGEARKRIGSDAWSQWANRGDFAWSEPKCNLFVYEVLKAAGAQVPLPNEGGKTKYFNIDNWFKDAGQRPPTASQWHDEKYAPLKDHWRIVQQLHESCPGDVITDGGHMGIISGSKKTISASTDTNTVVENDWGWRRDNTNVVVRRYKP